MWGMKCLAWNCQHSSCRVSEERRETPPNSNVTLKMHNVCTWNLVQTKSWIKATSWALFIGGQGCNVSALCSTLLVQGCGVWPAVWRLEWLSLEELACLLSGSNSCSPPIAPEGSLPEINGNMNGKALEVPSIASQSSLVEIHNTIDTFVFVVQVCI